MINQIQKRAVLADLRLIPSQIRHLGTGYTKIVLQAMQDYLVQKGVEIFTGIAVEEIIVNDGQIKGVRANRGDASI